MFNRWAAGLAAACVLICAPAAEARTWTVRSPAGTVTASVRAAGGTVTVTARRGGVRAFSARVRAGRIAAARRRNVRERFRTPAGKRRLHDVRAAVLTLAPGGGAGWRSWPPTTASPSVAAVRRGTACLAPHARGSSAT